MRVALLILALGCGSSEEPAPAEPTPTPTLTPTPTPTPEPSEPTCAPGFAVPFTPSAAQLRENRQALTKLGRQEHEAALADFESILAAAPAYDSARFNLACALARLGRVDEARAQLETLLCNDLPTNLTRARDDEDLAALRGGIDEIAARVLPRYRAASGTAIVAYGKTEVGSGSDAAHLHWSQAGSWTGQRFVPAAPRQQARERDGEAPLLAAAIAGDVAILVEGVSSAAEAEHLPPLTVRVTRVFEGRELTERRYDLSQDEYFDVSLGAVDARAWIGFESHFEGAPAPRIEWIDDQSRITTRPEPVVRLGMQTWAPAAPASPHQIRQRALHVGERTFELDRRHRAMNGSHVTTSDALALVVSAAVGDCGSADRWVVEMIDTHAGRTLWKSHGDGQILTRFRDGVLWLQHDDALFVLPDPTRDERTRLPAGFGLSSTWLSFNPMC